MRVGVFPHSAQRNGGNGVIVGVTGVLVAVMVGIGVALAVAVTITVIWSGVRIISALCVAVRAFALGVGVMRSHEAAYSASDDMMRAICKSRLIIISPRKQNHNNTCAQK